MTLVPGLWANSQGPLFQKLGNRFNIVNPCGLDTMEERVKLLIDHIEANPQVETLIGHSAGCVLITETLKHLPDGMIKKIILTNSGPLAGVKFMPWDPTIMATLPHLVEILTGKPVAMSPSEAKNLFSLSDDEAEEMMPNLQADSGKFVWSTILRQYRRQEKFEASPSTEMVVVNAANDRIIGSTATKTTEFLTAARSSFRTKVVTLGYGHMWSLQNMDKVMQAAA